MSGPTREQVAKWADQAGLGKITHPDNVARFELLAEAAYAAGQAAEREAVTNMPGLNFSERQRCAIRARGQQ